MHRRNHRISSLTTLALVAAPHLLLGTNAQAAPIGDPAQHVGAVEHLDFEESTGSTPISVGGMTITSNGSAPWHSGPSWTQWPGIYEGGWLGGGGYDWTFTFDQAVSEFGVGIFDPNYTGSTIVAYDANGMELERITAPSDEFTLGPPGGSHSTYVGFVRDTADIHTVVLDMADWNGIDNIRWSTSGPADEDGDGVPDDEDVCPGVDDVVWADGLDDITGFGVGIATAGDDVVLSWDAQPSGAVEVWRATNILDLPSVSGPCTAPAGPTAELVYAGSALDYTDVAAAARDYETPTYYYRVLTDGEEPDSAVVAKVTTEAAPGYTKFGLCMLDGVEHASDMLDVFGDAVVSVHLWDELAQNWTWWWASVGDGPFGDFTLPLGGAVSVNFDATVDPYLSLVGRVPTDEAALSVAPGFNVLTWPLASGDFQPSAYAYGEMMGYDAVGQWDPFSQTAHWAQDLGDTDFALEACRPFYVQD